MKKLFGFLTVLVFAVVFPSVFACADSYAVCGGTENVMVDDDSFYVTYTAYDIKNIYGISGEIVFDNRLVSYSGAQCLCSGFTLDTADNGKAVRFVMTDIDFETPISADSDLLRIDFTLLRHISGEEVDVSFQNVLFTNMYTDFSVGDVSFNRKITEEPLESDPSLESLIFPDCELDNKFDGSVYEYRLKFPEGMTSLEYEAVPVKDTTVVTATGTDKLNEVGKTKLVFSCKAENGSEVRYTVYAYPTEQLELVSSKQTVSGSTPELDISLAPNTYVIFLIAVNAIVLPACIILIIKKSKNIKKNKKE